MKNLLRVRSFVICTLLIIFVFCDANAQEYKQRLRDNFAKADSVFNLAFPVKEKLYYLFDYNDSKPLTVDLLLEYETECYNDSTEVMTHECPDNVPGCLLYHTWYKTIHKEPTFKDFLAWLRKKHYTRLE